MLKAQTAPDCPMILVGNKVFIAIPAVILTLKCDLEEQRKVATKQGQDMASSFKIPF